MIDGSNLFLLIVAVILMGLIVLRYPERLPDVWKKMKSQAGAVGLRLPVAMFAAALMARAISTTGVETLVGADSGFLGICIAIALGGVMPGGPMVAFPLALAFWRLGAGDVQMVAFLTAWSIYSISRIISFELPLLGWRFLSIRLASGAIMPFVASLIAWGLIQFR